MERLRETVSKGNGRLFLLILLMAMFSSIVVGNAFANPPAQVPKTGLTVSYARGDDGDLQRGVAWPSPRFIDNGNGTITDALTGLVWLKDANCFGALSWTEALTRVNALQGGRCGLSDGSTAGQWRLPNINELSSLIDFMRASPALPEGHPFRNIHWGCYWTSNIYLNDIYRAWIVHRGLGGRLIPHL